MNENYNDDWREELKLDYPEVYERFCLAKNTSKDLIVLSKLMYKYNKDKTKEQVLDRVIDWVTGLNNQVSLIPSENEYKKILKLLEN